MNLENNNIISLVIIDIDILIMCFFFNLNHRNGQNCEGADHRTVVDLIRQGENELSMAIISVTPSESRKLDGPTNMYGSSDYIDYSDRRSIPVSVPDFKHEEKNGDKYVVRYFTLIF